MPEITRRRALTAAAAVAATATAAVTHYDPVPTPRAAARAAVDELQGAPLLPFPTN
ncbi:hypothetical protein GCM10010360_74270 [Streptomyces nogalater]